MRVTFLTTVAAAALSLSLAAIAEASSGASGSTGGTSTTTSGSTGGTSGSTGGTSGGTSGTAGSGTGTGTGTGSPAPRPPAGATGGAASTQGGAAGTATTTGSAGAAGTSAGSVSLSTEQRTRAVTTLRSVNVPTVQENVNITVGQTVPTTVTTLVDCPETLESLITGVRDCKVVRVGNRYYIVEGSSRRVVTTIEAQ